LILWQESLQYRSDFRRSPVLNEVSLAMSDQTNNQQYNEQEEQSNSKVDAIAIGFIVLVLVAMTVFYVSR